MRHPQWVTRFSAYLYRASQARFSYGQMDCCQFTGQAIEALTGINPALAFSYTCRREAVRLIRAAGGFEAFIDRAMSGFEKLAPSFAQRGDAVLVKHDGKLAMGVVSLRGDKAIVKRRGTGLLLLPMKQVIAAWRV